MKRALALLLSFVVASTLFAGQTTDVYDFKMLIQVPRIYDNTHSLGQRKWQAQLICGQMLVNYDTCSLAPRITFVNCVNRSHKIGNKYVTYLCEEGCEETERRWVVMGNNYTRTFTQGSCYFHAEFNPSYNVGDDEPDNTLLLDFGGRGTLQPVRLAKGYALKVRRWTGFCVGMMGCGCRAYGHISPTRALGFCGPVLDEVVDVAAIPMGKWVAVYRCSY